MHQYAIMLPECLHRLGLSHWRRAVEKKEGRAVEKLDYVQIENMYFDWDCFYFKIQMPMPDGCPFSKLAAPEVTDSLEKTFISRVTVEYNDNPEHLRKGVWICVESKRGRNLVPTHTKWTDALKSCPKGSLIVPVGYGARGKLYTIDFHTVHNFLGAGMKGSGKSNLANLIIATLITNNTPDRLRIFAVDFKRVEMSGLNDLPHMGGGNIMWTIKKSGGKKGKAAKEDELAADFDEDDDEEEDNFEAELEEKAGKLKIDTRLKTWLATDTRLPANARAPIGNKIIGKPAELMLLLDYILAEGERRLDVLEKAKCRNIKAYNKKNPTKPLPTWILFIDELGQLDLLGPKDKAIAQLKLMLMVEKLRAAGIYTAYFTQTPNSDVLPTRVRANIPAAVAFYCGSPHQSLAILGNHDAHKKLPDHPGRAIFDWGHLREIVQVPEITDWQIEHAIKKAHNRPEEAAKPTYKIDPIKVFEWVLNENDGEAGVVPIYQKFRNEVGRREVEKILRDYQVNGHVTPIPIGEETYMLLPPSTAENSILNQSRKLVPYTPPTPPQTSHNDPPDREDYSQTSFMELVSPPVPVAKSEHEEYNEAEIELVASPLPSPPQNTNGTQKKLSDKEKILVEYLLEHPNASLNQVFKATGVPKNKDRLAILTEVKARLEAE